MERIQKRLFIIGASDFQLPAILKAKEMGLYVAVGDYNPNAIGIKYADEYFNVSTIDEVGICNAAKKFNSDGIITLCTDMPMRALSYTCEKLDLCGPSTDTARKATDKGLMIKAFEENNVAHPEYVIINSKNEIIKAVSKLEFPMIIKPTDNSGSRGVILARNKDELISAYEYSSKFGRSGTVIAEEYMVGPEFSVEIIVINKEPHVLQVTDKITTGSPHFVEIGHSQPSNYSIETIEQIKDIASRAAIAVGIENGPAHAEVILTSKGAKMVEIGARMGGGCITTHLVPLSTGIDMTEATIRIALGEEPDISPTIKKGSAIRFINPPKGKVIKISGKEEAEKIEGIKVVDIQCEVGQVLNELENGTGRIGYVIAQADNAIDALSICDKALEKISIKTSFGE